MTDAETRRALGEAGRIDWLDSLRGLAIFMVVSFHTTQTVRVGGKLDMVLELGRLGVQLFFIVSALTIALTYEGHIAKYGTSPRVQVAWFVRRFFRIAPLYYLAAIVNPLIEPSLAHAGYYRDLLPTLSDIMANFLFIHAWIPHAIDSVVPGGWSIGVEMFFYLLVPFIWMVKPVRARLIFLALLAIAGVATTLIVTKATIGTYDFGPSNVFLYQWFPTQLPVFALGLSFYFLRGTRLREVHDTKAALPWLAALVLYAGGFLFLWSHNLILHVMTPFLAGIAFLLLIMCLHGVVKPVFVNPAWAWLGRVSFSIYILHFLVLYGVKYAFDRLGLFNWLHGPLALVLGLVMVFPAVCVLALLTKRFIEDPAIAYGHALSKRLAESAQSPSPDGRQPA